MKNKRKLPPPPQIKYLIWAVAMWLLIHTKIKIIYLKQMAILEGEPLGQNHETPKKIVVSHFNSP